MLRVQLLHPDAKPPTRATAGSAGYDLYSNQMASCEPGGMMIVKTGIAVGIPEGHYGRIAPRSGMTVKHRTDVGAGVIDADYRGEVGVVIFNHSPVDLVITPGQRIAQLILEKTSTPDVVVVDQLNDTTRGTGGYGSTGN